MCGQMERPVIREASDSGGLAEIKKLFLEYAGSLGIDLGFQNFEEELHSLPGKYAPSEGALLLATVAGSPAGCIALRKFSPRICEMKRLYVRREYRKAGIGKMLIKAVLDRAVKQGYAFIRLDTLPTMQSAQKLYGSLGFYGIEPYVFNPVEGTLYLEKEL